MSPRTRFVVFLVLSGLAYSYGQTEESETTMDVDPTTTTTTAAPTTSVPATSKPDDKPKQGSWNVTKDGRTCIQTQMGIQLAFDYVDEKNVTQSVSYDVPADGNKTTVDGSCGGASTAADESLAIAFFDKWEFELTFKYDGGKKEWAVSEVKLTFVVDDNLFPNISNHATYTATLANQTLYQTPNGSSYQCVNELTLRGFDYEPTSGPTVNITTTDLRVEAFRTRSTAGDFSTPVPCPADTTVSNIVPIAVGAALAALVVIVLVAYLIGRKKNKRGYESV